MVLEYNVDSKCCCLSQQASEIHIVIISIIIMFAFLVIDGILFDFSLKHCFCHVRLHQLIFVAMNTPLQII